jgi:hypothetical protein
MYTMYEDKQIIILYNTIKMIICFDDADFVWLSRILIRKEKYDFNKKQFSLWKEECKRIAKLLKIDCFDSSDIRDIQKINSRYLSGKIGIRFDESLNVTVNF